MCTVLVDLHGDQPVDFPLGLITGYGHRGLWHLDEDGTGQVILTEDELSQAGPNGDANWRAVVVERLQEAFQESRAGWGQARPVCPEHTHPAQYRPDGLGVPENAGPDRAPRPASRKTWLTRPATARLPWSRGAADRAKRHPVRRRPAH